MQRRIWAFLMVCACGLALVAGFATAQQGGAAPSAEEQAMMAAMTPGEHHRHLDSMAGSWTTKFKMWMDPSQPPMESAGTAEAKWILDGRYLESVHKGNMMGMPFEGHGLEGYDNLAKEYVGTWVDNMGTGVMVTKGQCSDGGKVHTTAGDTLDPMTGKPTKVRMVTTTVDPKSYRMEMFMTPQGGSEFKSMEMVATRK